MAKRRGFFAEIAHQQKVAEQLRLEYARSMAEVAAIEARTESRIAEIHAETEARIAAIEAGHALRARIEAENAASAEQFAALDSLLVNALQEPPFRIQDLSEPAEHPPFAPGDLETPTPKPTLQQAPPEPVYQAPPEPQGLTKLFSKRQYLEAEQDAKAKWRKEHSAWSKYTKETLPEHNHKVMAQYQAAENERARQLGAARAAYEDQCVAREEIARADARDVEELAAAVRNNDQAAVQDFVDAILGHSRYPAAFQGSFEAAYDAESHEATVNVYVPDPASLPKVKAQKLVSSTWEIRETLCTQTEQKTRYNTAVAAVALRVLHELFNAEPSGIIETVSLTVGTETIDPATGLLKVFRFVAAAAARDEYLQYNLHQVEPIQTLGHLGADVSKNPFALKPISDVRGIRK